MKAIFKHELRSYFTSLQAYVFGAFILLFAGIYTTVYNIKMATANFEYSISGFGFIFMVTVPIITMRVIAEEKKNKTDQLLYSLPITMTDVVLGKFFALLVVFALPMAIISIYPLILSSFGNVDLRMAFCTIAAFFLLGAALLAIGVYISSLTESQAVAAGLCFVVMLINYMIKSLSGYISNAPYTSFLCFIGAAVLIAFIIYKMTENIPAGLISLAIMLAINLINFRANRRAYVNLFPNVLKKLSLYEAFYQFPNGVFNVGSIVYLLSVAVLFLFLTEQSLEKRRWS